MSVVRVQHRPGSLLIEAMMAILLFGMFATAAFGGLISGQEGSQGGSDRVRGVYFTTQALEVVKAIRDAGSVFNDSLPVTPVNQVKGFSLDDNGDWLFNTPGAADAPGVPYSYNGYESVLDIKDGEEGQKWITAATHWKHGYMRDGDISLTMGLTDWRDFSKTVGDWSNPSLLTEADDLESTDRPKRLALSADFKYVFAGGDDLYVFNVDLYPPSCVSCSLNIGTVKDLAVYNYKLFVVTNTNTIQRYDINVAGSPSSVGEPLYADFPFGSNIQTIYRHGPYLYVGLNSGGYDELQILDVSRLNEISWVGSVEVGRTINDIFIADNFVYLALDGQGVNDNEIRIYDVSDPATPAEHDLNNYTDTRPLTIKGRAGTYYIGYEDTQLRITEQAGEGTLEESAVPLDAGEAIAAIDADPTGCFVFAALDGQDQETTCPGDPDPIDCIGDPFVDVQFWPVKNANPVGVKQDWEYSSSIEDNPLVQDVLYNPWKDQVYVSAYDPAPNGLSHFFVFQPAVGSAIDPESCEAL